MKAASPKLNSVMRGTSMPMSRAAIGFSAQARKAWPRRVRLSRVQRATIITAEPPASHNPWVGMRRAPKVIGVSPENGGKA